MSYLAVAVMTLMGASGAFFFKKSAECMDGLFSLLRIPTFYLGGMLYAVSALMNVMLLRVMDYTVLYPLTATTYIWSLLIGSRFLGEKIHAKKALGIAMILAGVLLLAL